MDSINLTAEGYLTPDNHSFIKFYLFLISSILSVLCTLFLFYHFIFNRQLRRSIYNHVIFLLLLINFLTVTIPISFSIYFFRFSHSLIDSYLFCSFWNYFQYTFCFTNSCLMTFTCIERHLFIFHNQLYRIKLHRIFLHYIPIIFCLIYPSIFYLIAIFITQCTPLYDYMYIFCLWPCYFNIGNWLGIYDIFINNCLTNFLISFFSLMLLFRFMKQKIRMKQQIFKWRRDRKMLLQLFSISLFYIIFWLPTNFVSVVEIWYPEFLLQLEMDVFIWGPSFSNMIYPFICLLTYPELLYRRKKNTQRITPVNVT